MRLFCLYVFFLLKCFVGSVSGCFFVFLFLFSAFDVC